jgi:hypothetical protein
VASEPVRGTPRGPWAALYGGVGALAAAVAGWGVAREVPRVRPAREEGPREPGVVVAWRPHDAVAALAALPATLVGALVRWAAPLGVARPESLRRAARPRPAARAGLPEAAPVALGPRPSLRGVLADAVGGLAAWVAPLGVARSVPRAAAPSAPRAPTVEVVGLGLPRLGGNPLFAAVGALARAAAGIGVARGRRAAPRAAEAAAWPAPAPAPEVEAEGSREPVVVHPLSALVGLAFLAFALVVFFRRVGPVLAASDLQSRLDFSWYYLAWRIAWFHIQPALNLYNVAFAQSWMGQSGFHYDPLDLYAYPPSFALLFAPLGALPYGLARGLWSLFSLVTFWMAVGLAAVWGGGRRHPVRWAFLAAFGLLPVAVFNNFFWGQVDGLVLALVAFGLYLALGEHRDPRAATWGGVLLGLGTALKVTPGILLVYLLLRAWGAPGTPRGARAAQAARAGWFTLAVAFLVSGAVLGFGTWWTYAFSTIGAVERAAWAHGPAPWNQSFEGVVGIWTHGGGATSLLGDLWGIASLAAALWTALRWRRIDLRLEAAVASSLVLVASPVLENHEFTALVLPWLLLGGWLWDGAVRAGLRRVAIGGLAWAFAAVALLAPNALRWPPAFLQPGTTVPVPAGSYRALYLLGAASYGPVDFNLELRYAGTSPELVATEWPDWWSPGNPLPAVVSGSAVHQGQVAHAVGLYAFRYPVDPAWPLTAIGLPRRLPRQPSGGQEVVHLVAATLARAGGGYLEVPIPYNDKGIVPTEAAAKGPQSFDGYGYWFWSPDWPTGMFWVRVGGRRVPFLLPSPYQARNVFNAPAPTPAPAGLGPVLLDRAPWFLGMLALFLVGVGYGLAGPGPRPAAEAWAARRLGAA